jgi:imidazolonepropionase-like amidohydrolase
MLLRVIYFLLFSLILGQTKPSVGLKENNPMVWALTNALVHTEPGDSIKDCTIIIRDGKIDKVGRYIKIPLDAYEIDMEGSYIYPGFIDSWYEVKKSKEKKPSSSHWNKNINAEYRARNDLDIKEKDLNNLHSLGITAAHIVPEKGIIKGTSDLILLDENYNSLSQDVAQVIEYKTSKWSDKIYPNSLLGVIALLRQTFLDANWYVKSNAIINNFPELNKPLHKNKSLEILGKNIEDKKPTLFITKEEHSAIRSLNIAKEFNLKPWILSSGYEYRRLREIKDQKPFIIVPLNFPKSPKVSNPYDAMQYSTEKLQHWEMAPDNLKKIYDSGMTFSLTTYKSEKDFRKNLQRVSDRGLSKDILLASLTTFPAEAMGVEKFIGKIQTGFMANLVVTDGDYFNPKSRVTSVWLSGKEKYLAPKFKFDIKGKWVLRFNEQDYDFTFAKNNNSEMPDYGKMKGTFDYKGVVSETINLEIIENKISFSIQAFEFQDPLFFEGNITPKKIIGDVSDIENNKYSFSFKKIKEDEKVNRVKEVQSNIPLYFPSGSYGSSLELLNPNAILINDITIWTSGPKGKLIDWDILFVNGKIDKIAPDISVPMGSALIIDGTNKHLTPGLIDCHSHSAASSINEGSQSVTAEVRIKDVLFADDINIYRQLAGGLTTANILHGSANPIGGQNAVIKLRWGLGPNELLFKEAPQGIKFALGENVKQANWSGSDRYPQTRMGVEQIIRDSFRAAQDYSHAQKTYRRNSKAHRKLAPPRIDLELEALSEILTGERLVHCHSYRQDEILMLTRIAEDFGFRISTFQHVLEGYKVADRIAEHGAGASTFSDWWQYKYEVIDAIPHNGSLMAKNNVLVSFNSDDAELARRLNTEAAKAIKYGNLSEEEALNFVTINPAKQLQIDQWVGSLEEGKDADFVLWDGNPLSIYSKVLETWIDGKRYWSIDENLELEERDKKLRNDIISRILLSPRGSKESMAPDNKSKTSGHNCDLSDDQLSTWESQ